MIIYGRFWVITEAWRLLPQRIADETTAWHARAAFELHQVEFLKAGEVETWLRSLPLARASCARIRKLMSFVFNHGICYGTCEMHPIRLARQGAKRRSIPLVFTPEEIRKLIDILPRAQAFV